MARVALAVEEGELFGVDLALRIDRRAAVAIVEADGREVLLYGHDAGAGLRFIGAAHVAALEFEESEGRLMCRLAEVVVFENAVSGEGEVVPWGGAPIAMDDERFSRIVAAGRMRRGAGFEDQQAVFSPSLDIYQTIHRQVLERWDYRCAVTGARFDSAAGTSGELRVVPIRPRELGGPLHVRNYLPLVERAARALQLGVIGVDADLNLHLQPNALDPELFELVRLDGRLTVPADPDLGPDPAHLAYHFFVVCGRWTGQSPLRE